MTLDSARARAPFVSQDSLPFSVPQQEKGHQRQRSKTVGTTFVSTTVVPAPSSSEVLSSLITSLTVLSDSAREQIRSARELEAATAQSSPEFITPGFTSSTEYDHEAEVPYQSEPCATALSEGDEAEAPIVGYTRGSGDKPKQSSAKEKWATLGAGKDTTLNIFRSGSSQALRRPPSSARSIPHASPGFGIPSIDRARSASSQSRPISPSASAKSPLKMFFSKHHDDEHALSHKDSDSKSFKSFKTWRSKHSKRPSTEHERDLHTPITPQQIDEPLPSPVKESPRTESRAYNPLNPSVRDDLAEHLIPSRRSSVRRSLRRRRSSKGRSPSTGGDSIAQPKSPARTQTETAAHVIDEQPFDEEDSTLRRIRELQQAKERRQQEWRTESRMSEHRSKPSMSRAKSRDGATSAAEHLDHSAATNSEDNPLPKVPSHLLLETASISGSIGPEPPFSYTPRMFSPSPSPGSPLVRAHKRSLSTTLKRAGSMKQRPSDDVRHVREQVEAFLNAPRLTQRIRHPRTARTIAFSEVGDPDGFVVFCCVGMGLTRYVTTFYDDIARTQKLRLITPDRPGVGETSPFPDNVCTPLSWVDDIAIICQTLNIDKFSLLAHSAGSIYALATALKMPDRVRGRVHLLAPWIPPSQFSNASASSEIKVANLPIAHKILSVLPTPFLKAANSKFLSATSASIEPRSGKGRKKDQSISANYDSLISEIAADMRPDNLPPPGSSMGHYLSRSQSGFTPSPTPPPRNYSNSIASLPTSPSPSAMQRQVSISGRKFRSPTPSESPVTLTPQAKKALFNSELTHSTWALATSNSNPAVDLMVCLERRRRIGFKYTDVTRSVVIHHGRNDARVPLENVQWLSKAMMRCELRVLDDEGHGLMASANVMSKVLGEIGREWEQWDMIAKEQERKKRDLQLEMERAKEVERKRFIRKGY